MQNLRTSVSAAGIMLAAALCIFGQTGTSTTLTAGRAVAAQFEDGPPLGSMQLVPGEVVYFSFFADGFRKSATGRVELTGHVQVFDPSGIAIAPKEEIPILTNLSEEDKNWKPKLRAAISIPPIAPPGSYKVKYDVTDEQSHQTASGESSFSVEAKYVAPSASLAIRELNFYRNQEDTTALITPSYRAGDIVWVKFYITGYKYGEQNSIDASYDVELLSPDGTSIMKKEDAAMEKSMAFYPQPYIPGIFNLSLKPTMSHNVYTLVITAHDAMGKQTATATSKFQVN
jgi:methionine-rich copper-binding protein CopC